MNYIIQKDGTINLFSNGALVLEHLWPGIDGHPVSGCSMEYDSDKIIWNTEDGEILVQFTGQDEACISLKFALKHWKKKIHTFSFFYQSDVYAEGFYQAAEGMGQDTGYYSVDSLVKERNLASYGICSLKLENTAVTIFSAFADHYETVCEIDTYQRKKYVNGDSNEKNDTVVRLSCHALLEETNGEEYSFAELKFLETKTIEEGLMQAAGEIGKNMKARFDKPPAYHWCSWYYYYHNLDMQQLQEYLDGLQTMEEKIPIRYIQIDAGYFPANGDWLLSNERFPDGLEPAFHAIREAGYEPGIWIGPYMVGNRSRLYREHPDWILYDREDKPIRGFIMDNEPKYSGYQDEEYYVLDTSHPDAMQYMRTVFTTLHEWGANLFKTDFMKWGLIDSTQVKRHTPGKTSVEYFRDFLQMIRECIGEESYWLGCIAPFQPFIGYADGMRIGGDVGSSWNGDYSPQNMIKSVVGNNYMNHSYYQIDADAVMLRDFHIRLTEREIISLALLAGISGSCIYTSDPLHLIGENRQKLFRFLEPDGERHLASVPFLASERQDIVMTVKNDHRGLLYILNKTETPLKEIYDLKDLGFDPAWNVIGMDGETAPVWTDRLAIEIPPHGCKLFVLADDASVKPDLSKLWGNLRG